MQKRSEKYQCTKKVEKKKKRNYSKIITVIAVFCFSYFIFYKKLKRYKIKNKTTDGQVNGKYFWYLFVL